MSQHNYSLGEFGWMIDDKVRTDPYFAAIARSVKSNDSVVDLGCGPGVFALLACKAGARRVYAIDTNGVVDSAASSLRLTASLGKSFSCAETPGKFISRSA